MIWRPLEMLAAARLVNLSDWMHMGTLGDDNFVESYKHIDTRVYLYADHGGHTRGRLLEHQTMPLDTFWMPLPEVTR